MKDEITAKVTENDTTLNTENVVEKEEELPSVLAVKIFNSLRLLGSKSLDMRNIPGALEDVTEAVRWLEDRKYLEVVKGTMLMKGKSFSAWPYQ